jgi:type II secretion system protein H
MTNQHASRSTHHASLSGFTLVELLLVMVIMVAAISISAPMLANFFRGRTLDSEARRLLALTRHGQSRAVSEGVPMLLWVDETKRGYGLKAEPGWEERDPKAEDFKLDQDLHLEIVAANPPQRASSRNQPSSGSLAGALAQADGGSLPKVRFLPDGTIDETSPRALRLVDRDGTSVWLAQTANHLNYELRKEFE